MGRPCLLLATGNRHKVTELVSILAGVPVDLVALPDLPPVPPPPEEGASFVEIAVAKATYYARATGRRSVAEDSGLVVEALDGAPGLHTARFAGPEATSAENRALLLQRMREVPDGRRYAAFQCALALVDPAGNVRFQATGEVRGTIIREERGEGGFGYDPVFVPEGHRLSFAQMPQEIKNGLSHRARAAALLRAFLLATPAEDLI